MAGGRVLPVRPMASLRDDSGGHIHHTRPGVYCWSFRRLESQPLAPLLHCDNSCQSVALMKSTKMCVLISQASLSYTWIKQAGLDLTIAMPASFFVCCGGCCL